MPVQVGLDVFRGAGFDKVLGRRVGLVCNQATIGADFSHAITNFQKGASDFGFELKAYFGPQHGIWGHTQDNMIEWEGYTDPDTGLKFYSLYGEHREPTPEMLEGIDCLVIDLPDIGSRYYTFLWTMALCMKASQDARIKVVVLDRPNPIGGTQVEGSVLEPGFSSFVGLYPLPLRHGMTLGEVAWLLQSRYFPDISLEVVPCMGWARDMQFEDTGLPWAMPSPNMPTPDTARVYPGMCLLEGTLLSEGRGTTRPFEIFGAPYIHAATLCRRLNAIDLPGVHFRPIQFQPTFQKFAGEICQGAFIHVVNKDSFEPVLSAVAILQEVFKLYEDEFRWLEPPYEYERIKRPIDILAGNSWLREAVEFSEPLQAVRSRMKAECEGFEPLRRKSLIYP